MELPDLPAGCFEIKLLAILIGLKMLRVLRSFFESFASFSKDIKFAHSIFALPFAMSAIVIGNIPVPSPKQILLLLVAMVSARSFAMGMNRYLDRKIDSKNPRTTNRQIPKGALKARHSLFWSLGMGLVFIASAFLLNNMAGVLSIPVLVILAGYSMMKRISWLTHWYLGACLGLAPIAVSIALTGTVSAVIICIGLAVTMWTAGFDILYSIQDRQFDVDNQLCSVPAKFGPWNSVLLSRFCFGAMLFLLIVAGLISNTGAFYYIAVSGVAIVLSIEQWMVRDVKLNGTSQNITAAFFNVNAWVSVIFYAFVQLDYLF